MEVEASAGCQGPTGSRPVPPENSSSRLTLQTHLLRHPFPFQVTMSAGKAPLGVGGGEAWAGLDEGSELPTSAAAKVRVRVTIVLFLPLEGT